MSARTDRIRQCLESNRHTRWTGLLSARKVVETEHGHLSFRRDRELLALLSDDPKGGYCYGHVLRVDPVELEREEETSVWAAVVIYVAVRIEADTVDLLFRRFRHWVPRMGKYSPCHAQEHDDVFKLTGSYSEAVEALSEMIRRFDPYLRDGPPDFWTDEESVEMSDLPRSPEEPKIVWNLDMRCFDVYGGIMGCWEYTKESEDGHVCP